MNAIQEKVNHCVEQVRRRVTELPRIGIVLGSGLGDLAEKMENPVYVPYAEIDGFPTSTAPGHVGRFVFGRFEGVPTVMMQGRIHLYEGYPVSDCVLPIRLMASLGIDTLILTNAAGAINKTYHVGDFCLLKDHISSFVPSPLLGQNVSEWGVRFPDMSEVYDAQLREKMHRAAQKVGCTLHDGVYIQFTGPAYETPAEIRMASAMGADMAGMSTVIEAIAAHHMGVRLVGVSLATNLAAGVGAAKLSEEEVIEEGKKAATRFQAMIRNFVAL
ncbi:purine-nucleoside phosphorylase [uncultured Murdochiella sp.]|uniref:purine-nucleoside phosphorylase n=1 Tax=uncultured Murdochiella sp. TaxID=1586095 RepID=UPI002803D361|nr:purine-nucleoside phosphorylase [uncultured Murdochiella sp.]